MASSLRVISLLGVVAAACCHGQTREAARPQPKPGATASTPTTSPPLPTSAPAVEASSPPACVRVGGSIPAPRKLHHKGADLSEGARNVSTHGGVLLYEAIIDEQGQVRDVHLVKPVDPAAPWPEIEQAWRTAIADWRYEPTLVNGKATRVCMTVSVLLHVQ